MDPGPSALLLDGARLLGVPELAVLPSGRELREQSLRQRALPRVRPRRSLQLGAALRRGSLPAIAVLLCVASPARAQSALDAADREYAAGRIAAAGRGYEDALATGDLSPPVLARVHARLGVIAALGDDELAARHFALALAIDPALASPSELDDARRARFEAMRGDGVFVRVERVGPGLVIDVVGAPGELARTIEVRGVEWRRRFPWGEGELRTIHPPPSAMPIEVWLLDPHGNRVARAAYGALPAAAPVVPAPDPGQALIESPWLWVALGVILLGVGVAIGVSASGERFVLGAPVIR